MNVLIDTFLKKMRTLYRLLYGEKMNDLGYEVDKQKCSDIIYNYLISPEPCMIARYGKVEFTCLMNYLGIKNRHKNLIKYVKGEALPWWWTKETRFMMVNNAGFFPSKPEYLERFSMLLLEDTRELDILGSWINDEVLIKDLLVDVKKIKLPFFEPYWCENTWSRALKGKKVLVVHPFSDLIMKQYTENRTRLFKNPNVLPNFDLKVLKAVQSMGGDNNGFKTWFDALEWMKNEISKIDFDICIIGCGAYGFHLAAHVKRIGKKALHLGGATQLMFGIKGKRWEDFNYGVNEWGLPLGFYVNLKNEYWVRPDSSVRPKNADSIEGACYW